MTHSETMCVPSRTLPPLKTALLAIAISALPTLAFADVGAPAVGPTVGGDDNNYTKLVPYDANSPANLMKARFVSYCSWINAAMNKFVQGHPNYSFNWAGAGNQITQNIQGDIDVTTYQAWAGTSVDVTGGDGKKRNQGFNNAEAGGANIVFNYTPKNVGDPTNVRFIQAYNESLTGSPYQIYLDTPANSATPFYDNYAVSGTKDGTQKFGGRLANNVSWFQDRPADEERLLMARANTAEGANEIDTNSDVQFQVVVAVDNGAVPNTGITDNLTLYGGLWWGYNYWNNDNVAVTTADPAVDPLNEDTEPYVVNSGDDPLSPGLTDSVPEPTCLAGVAAALPLLLRRRRAK